MMMMMHNLRLSPFLHPFQAKENQCIMFLIGIPPQHLTNVMKSKKCVLHEWILEHILWKPPSI